MGQQNEFITDYCSEKSSRCRSKFMMMSQENEGGSFTVATHRKAQKTRGQSFNYTAI